MKKLWNRYLNFIQWNKLKSIEGTMLWRPIFTECLKKIAENQMVVKEEDVQEFFLETSEPIRSKKCKLQSLASELKFCTSIQMWARCIFLRQKTTWIQHRRFQFIIALIIEPTTAFSRFHVPFAFNLFSDWSKGMERFFKIFMARGNHPNKSYSPKATLSIPHGPIGPDPTPLPPEK